MVVDVIIPCYNAARFIGDAIESVLCQSHADTRTFVVDDGSTDGTVELAAAWGSRVTLIRQPNLGPSVARNRAIDASHGDFIAFLDADDRWHPNKLSRQLAFLREHPACGLVHTDVRYIDSTGRVTGRPIRPRAQGFCLADLLERDSITTSSVVLRRDVLREDRFPADLRAAEDWDLWLRLAARTLVGYLDEPLTEYRLHDANTRRSEELMLRGELAVLERAVARGVFPSERRSAMRHRREILAAYGHLLYERGDLAQACSLFRQAGTTLDWVGLVRYVASGLPPGVRQPLRTLWRRLMRTKEAAKCA